MKNVRDNLKKSRKSFVSDGLPERKTAGNARGMSIEEARKAEKAFNDGLRIFREVAALKRKNAE